MRNPNLAVSVVLAILGIAGAGTASAADLEARPYAKENFIVPVYSWSGLYAGANFGYGWGRSSDTSSLSVGLPPPVFADTLGLDRNGILGGGQIGYNLQMQSWVLGLETDFQGTGQRSTHSFICPVGVCTAGVALPVTLRQQLDYFGTLRGRLGVALVPTVLLYATGGLAYGQVDSNTTLTGAARQQNDNPGYAVGGGIEGAIGGNWSAKLEYLYLNLGTIAGTYSSTTVAVGGAATVLGSFSSRMTDNIVRVGLNYRFSGPDIPKY